MTKAVKGIGIGVLVLILAAIGFTLGFTSLADTSPEASWGMSADALTEEGSFREAVDAVNNGTASYIRLENGFSSDEAFRIRENATLDYNGVTVRTGKYFITLEEDAVLTLKDTRGGANHRHDGSSYTPFTVCDDATLIVESGHYESIGSIIRTEEGGHPTNAVVVISGGEFLSENNSFMNAWGRSVTISGGTFLGDEPGGLSFSRGTVTVTTYIENFCIQVADAELFSSIMLPDNLILVDSKGNAVTENGIDEMYLQKAISFTLKGEGDDSETVKLVAGADAPLFLPVTFEVPQGKIFAGWSLTRGGEPVTDISSFSGDEILYALWEDKADVYVGGVALKDGEYLASGAMAAVTQKPDDFLGYAYYKDGTLTLHNFFYSDEKSVKQSAAAITSYVELTVVLSGKSVVTHSHLGIMAEEKLTLAGDGALWLSAERGGISAEKAFIQRSGTLFLTEYAGNAIYAGGDGSFLGGSLEIDHYGEAAIFIGGKVTLEGTDIYIYAGEYAALEAGGDVTVKSSVLDIFSYGSHPTFYVPSGDVLFENSTVMIDSLGLPFSALDKLTVINTVLTVQGEDAGIYAGGGVEISGKESSVYVYADNGYSLVIDVGSTVKTEGLSVFLPTEAELTEVSFLEKDCLAFTDGEGGALDFLLINGEPISFEKEYSFDFYEHWHKPLNCPSLDQANRFSENFTALALGEHTEEGSCTVCDYGTRSASLWIGGVPLKAGEYFGSDGKTYTEKPQDMGYAYYKDGTLTLVGFIYSGEGVGLYLNETVEIDGVISSSTDLTIVLAGENKLTATHGEGIDIYGDLTVLGSLGASLTVTAESDGIYVKGGDLVIKDLPLLTVLTGDDSLDVTEGDVKISNSEITLRAGDNGIEIDAEEEDGKPGLLFIKESVLETDAEDNGIDVYGDVKIQGSTLKVTAMACTLSAYGDVALSGSVLHLVALKEAAISGEEIILNGSLVTLCTKGGILDSTSVSGIIAEELVMHSGSLDITYASVGIWAEESISFLGGTVTVTADDMLVGSLEDAIVFGCEQGILSDNAELAGEGHYIFRKKDDGGSLRIGFKAAAHQDLSASATCGKCGTVLGTPVDFGALKAKNGKVGERTLGFKGELPENVFVLYVGREGTVYQSTKAPTEKGLYTALFYADAESGACGSLELDFEIKEGASLLWLWITLPCVLLLGGGLALYLLVFRKRRRAV